ncbi:MAG: UDP-N-acetylglucosamine 2-epimerase [Candidatus Omnitrophica bacterium]|nr:UDP-N-acetylglucosamine 2-epimerase [Candidatus Omnitrophota bacterium]
MIHIFIGTKAQYIKTAPLIRLLDEKGIEYNLIDSGQHAAFSKEVRPHLAIRNPDIYLRRNNDIDTILDAILWMGKTLAQIIFKPKFIKKNIFKDKKGICIVHGDTPSTLLAVLMAKRAGLKVAHIEAGLRSYNYFDPFPEELVRVISMKLSDYLFIPSEEAAHNVEKMKCKGKKIKLGVNTNIESLHYALALAKGECNLKKPYALLTFHRVETLTNSKRIKFIIRLINHITTLMPVVFITHTCTKKALIRLHMLNDFTQNEKIIIKELVSHCEFLQYLKSCDFILTDGGSIQEEAYYLNKPCLILRKRTERPEGLDENAVVSNFNFEENISFVKRYREFKRKSAVENIHPSQIILETLKGYAQVN